MLFGASVCIRVAKKHVYSWAVRYCQQSLSQMKMDRNINIWAYRSAKTTTLNDKIYRLENFTWGKFCVFSLAQNTHKLTWFLVPYGACRSILKLYITLSVRLSVAHLRSVLNLQTFDGFINTCVIVVWPRVRQSFRGDKLFCWLSGLITNCTASTLCNDKWFHRNYLLVVRLCFWTSEGTCCWF